MEISCNFENWANYIMKYFQELYEKEDKCDLEISCNKEIFLVHRIVMAACSDYVRDLNEREHIILPDQISCKTLRIIINFVYFGKITFNKDEKEELMLAASLLNMKLLLELIKPEESGCYTVQIDDEDIDESISDATKMSQTQLSSSSTNCVPVMNDENQAPTVVDSARKGVKRKSDVKKNKSANSSCILPPLHKFPYLQQKYSASRTYGLIASITSASPSRFLASEHELAKSPYKCGFLGVSYDCEQLYEDCDILTDLDCEQEKFLRTLQESGGNKRSYSNGLYSPYDRYQPQYNARIISDHKSWSRRPSTTIVSYPPKSPHNRIASPLEQPAPHDNVPKLAPEPSTQLSAISEAPTVPQSAASSKSYKRAPKEITQPFTSAEHTLTTLTTTPPRKQVRFSDKVNFHMIDTADDFSTEAMQVLDTDTLPEPIQPSKIVEGPYTIDDIEKDENFTGSELISLNNVIVNVNYNQLTTTAADNFATGCEEFTKLKHVAVNEADEEMLEQELAAPHELQYRFPQPSHTTMENPNESSHSASDPAIIDLGNSPENSHGEKEVEVINVIDPKTPTSKGSPKYVLKVKGNEVTDPVHLSKLVGICKQNSLFKDKNVQFKVVPLKGLKKQTTEALFTSPVNKAIIVKRKISSLSPAVGSYTELDWTQNTLVDGPLSRLSESQIPAGPPSSKKIIETTSIENVNGPWICGKCSTQGQQFSSYFDFRTHLHSVHNELENNIYCIHCGHRSLKRNNQLYHLFVRHKVAPPPNVTFPKCSKCDFYALNEYSLQKHLVSHPKCASPFQCPCKETFKTRELMQQHISSGDCKSKKTFSCGYCKGAFDRYVNLKAHMRVCMKERSKPIFDSSSSNHVLFKSKTVTK